MIDFINNITQSTKLNSYNEEQTKHAIVLPILKNLAWDVFNPDEVIPEYEINNGRVDYALFNKDERKCFIECKRVREELSQHEEQLVMYCAACGVKLAILTNGITWSFYLPLQEGDWLERKFYSIDLIEQDSVEVIQKFEELLQKENVLNGSTFVYAEELLNSRIKYRKISNGLPQVWNNLISDPDPVLLDLLIDNTESKTGYRPSEKNVIDFLRKNKETIIIDEKKRESRPGRRSIKSESKSRKTSSGFKPSSAIIDGLKIEIRKPSRDPLIIVSDYLIKKNMLKKSDCPVSIGGQRVRYMYNTKPVHPKGNPYLSEYKLSNGIYLNTHYSVEDAISWSKRILQHFGLSRDLIKFK